MARETIVIDGRPVETLKELLRPGLRAVFVGINPAPKSVAAGHYYQGPLGRRLWSRLQDYAITSGLPYGHEDVAAFSLGFGFADLIRRPTPNAKALSAHELSKGADDLVPRLELLGDRPLILFVFAMAANAASVPLENAGFRTARLPGPYAAKTIVSSTMQNVARLVSGNIQ